MKWIDILKETVTQSRVKEIEDIDIDIEDDECNRKLQKMYNKLKNYNLLLRQRWEAGWPRYAEYFDAKRNERDEISSRFTIYEKPKKGELDNFFAVFHERTDFIYNPVPEPVACKALEILKSHQRTYSDGGSIDSHKTHYFEHDGVTWKIVRSFNFDYQDNHNKLVIMKEEEWPPLIRLEWGNGESFFGIYDKNNKRIDTSGINKYSGYYDAREFGFSWHE